MGNLCSTKPDVKHPFVENEQQSMKFSSSVQIGVVLNDTVQEKKGIIQKEYSFSSKALGQGTFGEVRKAVHKKTKQKRAIKMIHKSLTNKYEMEQLNHEVEILKALDHPNIIKVYEYYQDSRYFYIVTELCQGGELFDKIQKEKHFTEAKAAQIMRQLLSAVCYCHKHKIVHRDLKPENLLLESNESDSMIKVIDFGTSRQFENNEKLFQRLGTVFEPYYIAPEVLKRSYNEKCDIWSCGVILYIMLCGYPPFKGKNDEQIFQNVSLGQYDFNSKEWDEVSQKAKDLIKNMLQLDPAIRYSAQQCLLDPWFQANYEDKKINMMSALNNMKTFRATEKLQKAAYNYIVNQFTTQQEKAELLKTFQALDKNGDGVLSKEELIDGFKNIYGEEEVVSQVEKIMIEVDKNQSGTIDYSEFIMATMNREKMLSNQRLEEAFSTIDTVNQKVFLIQQDKSGTLTLNELKSMFGGGKVPQQIWISIIQEVDKDSDGNISLQEFKEMMMKLKVT